jgi:predicted RNA-binding protein with RPS1 domain
MKNKVQAGAVIEGTVVRVYPSYAIMLFDDGLTGLLHVTELSNNYVHNFTGYVGVGNIYKVKVLSLDETKNFAKVSLKQVSLAERKAPLSHQAIDPSQVDFSELAKRLPEWVKEENAEPLQEQTKGA